MPLLRPLFVLSATVARIASRAGASRRTRNDDTVSRTWGNSANRCQPNLNNRRAVAVEMPPDQQL
eukprot:6251297-Pyramimonas_sp.AAC.1